MVKDAEQTRQEEVEGIASVLKGLPEDQRMAVDAMTRAIVKKVLHRPLRTVRDWAEAGTVDKAEAVFQAFGVVEKDDE